MIVAGAIASVLGLATALVALSSCSASGASSRCGVARRRRRLVVAVGAIAIRGSDLDAFARFLGASTGAQRSRADEGADVCAPHAARLARLRDLEGPPAARRRLGGLGGAGELHAVHAGGAPALPGRVAARVPGAPRRTAATACRTRGSRRSPTSASSASSLWVARLRARGCSPCARVRRRRALYRAAR